MPQIALVVAQKQMKITIPVANVALLVYVGSTIIANWITTRI